MKKFLCYLVFGLSLLSVHAQTQNPQDEMQTLVSKVDSLEHELSYLKLTYELYTLNTDLKIFANEVYAKTVGIKLDLYNRNFDSGLGDAYQYYYDSCKAQMQAYSELVDAKKKLFTMKITTFPYTETEKNSLIASYNVIDNAYESLESSVKLLKIVVGLYKDAL